MDHSGSEVTVWLALVLLSVASFVVIEGDLLTSIAALIVIGVAVLKVRLIMTHFMETRSAPRTWQLMYTSWILLVATIIIVGNYVAVASA
jgi:heme/copper-type cytochrome/quinol oxidase subunit 4